MDSTTPNEIAFVAKLKYLPLPEIIGISCTILGTYYLVDSGSL